MTEASSFIDFYRAHDISPVHQDITDLQRHFERRDSLYRHLGLPSAFVAGRTVAEFGPGSGHNALFTASLGPARYTLIDGNPRGIAETGALLSRYGVPDSMWSIVQSDFETFDTADRFDLVLAEGCLPYQAAALDLLERISRFVRPKGLLVITTVTPLSILPEIMRRLMRDCVLPPGAPPERQLPVLRAMLGPHLTALPGMTRPIDDWLLDNIVRPLWNTQTMSIPQVIAQLGDRFDVYGASPAFLTDLRWYKRIHGSDRGFNDNAEKRYFAIAANLIDSRFEVPPCDPAFCRKLEEDCTQVWALMCALEETGRGSPTDAVGILEGIAADLRSLLPETAAAIEEGCRVLLGRLRAEECSVFAGFWGRGQQYLSLIRRDAWSGAGV